MQRRLRAQWNKKLSQIQLGGAHGSGQDADLHGAVSRAALSRACSRSTGATTAPLTTQIHNGESYTAYSIWDTFRAENSMLTLLAPERIDGMITALLQNFKEGGWMPKWPNPSYTNIMIGTHADSLVAEAFRKGFHGFDSNWPGRPSTRMP